ncbi:MAG: hypothetical protein AAFY81_11565, partial [Pseudomonadota bacterium]
MPLLARALTLLCSFPAPLMAEEHPVSRNGITLVPEPMLSQRLVGGYDLAAGATEAHDNAPFASRSAADVIAFLKIDGFKALFYEHSDRIGIMVRRLVNIFYNTARLVFFFEDGQFVKAKVGA